MAVGETIGRAFVRILADGSGLPQSIKDEVKGNEAAFESQGKKDFASYAEGRDKALEEKPTLRAVLGDIRKSAAEFDVAGQFAGEKIDDGLLRKMDVEFRKRFGPEVGERMSAALREAIVNEQTLGAVREFAQRSGTEALKATEKILKEEKKAADEVEKAWRKSFDDINRDSDRMVASIRKDTEDLWQAVGFIARKTGEGFTEEFDKIAKDFEKDAGKIVDSTDEIGDGIRRNKADISGLSVVVGKTFGKGSRNNALNFFGTLIGGISNLIEHIPGLNFLLGDMSKAFEKSAQTGEGFFSTVFEGGLAEGAATLSKGLLGLGITGSFVVALLGPLVSLFAGIAGGIIAIASSIGFALAAGLGVFVGLLAPLAAGIGAVVLGLSGLDGSRVKNALSPVIDGFKRLKEAAGKELTDALVEIGPALGRAFKRVTPLIDAMIGSLGKLVSEFAEIFGSPAFKKFASQMADVLPHMTNQLGEIFKRFGRIAFGIFRGLIPITREFLGWLRPILNDFAEWINSAKGQTAVKKFFREAGDSAKVVGDLIKDIAKAIGKLLAGGKDTGDSLLGDLDKKVEDFVNFLDKNPDTLSNWFADAKEITANIGGIADAILEIIDALDNPTFRGVVKFFLEIADAVFSVAAALLRWSDGLLLLSPPIGIVVGLFKLLKGQAEDFVHFLGRAVGAIGDFFGNLGDGFSPSKIAGLINPGAILNSIMHALPDIDLSKIIDVAKVAGKILGAFAGMVGRILKAIGTFFVDRIIDIASVAGKIIGAIPTPGEILNSIVKFAAEAMFDLSKVASSILDSLPSALDIAKHIGEITLSAIMSISWPDPPGGMSWGDIGNFIIANPSASGGVFDGPQTRLIGEAGPEAIVPLNRPLSQVDPAVRMLSAIAQGKFGALGQTSGRRPIDVGGITVITPVQDPRAVATQVLNQLAATSYF